jgi:hypothetical protein
LSERKFLSFWRSISSRNLHKFEGDFMDHFARHVQELNEHVNVYYHAERSLPSLK